MKIVICVFLFFAFSLLVWAQPPDSVWSRTYGLAGEDDGQSLWPTPDGGFIVVGGLDSEPSLNAWMIKCDANGDSMWSREFGGTLAHRAYDIKPTADGGYVIAGQANDFPGGDFLLIKTDANGTEEWRRHYGGTFREEARAVFQAGDGGFVIAGETQTFGSGESDFWIVRTNANGDSVSSRTFGGPLADLCYDMAPGGDGSILLAGTSYSYGAGNVDIWLVKVGANGYSLWIRTFGSFIGDQCYDIALTTDGSLLLAGQTQGFGASAVDFWLVQMTSDGDSLWSRRYGGSSFDMCQSLWINADGTRVLAGRSQSFGAGDYDFLIIKTSATGDSLWSRTFGGPASDVAWSVVRTIDGGYVAAGTTESYGEGVSDIWLAKIAAEPPNNADDFILQASSFSLTAYPNPFNATTQIRFDVPQTAHVELRIYDVQGRLVDELASRMFEAGSHSVSYDAGNRATGMYIVKMTSGEFSSAQKVMLLK